MATKAAAKKQKHFFSIFIFLFFLFFIKNKK